jgi:hypothetical protein
MPHRRFKPWMLSGNAGNISWRMKRVVVRGVNAGLKVTSTTGGTHAPGSYHYQGRAVDFGHVRPGTAEARRELVKFQKSELSRFRRRLSPVRHKEILGPDNQAIVLRGYETDLSEGTGLEQAHDNHVHVAI